ncbi:unnamed protein product [Protopolystoma xenopodis]|uniref:Neurotransmitter-gated ion-channel ligand-binding domain-containing protein n=1 Tax=Protopolystoma xenopodis TaxID=117903 RepID=A0A3S4ZG92_9PLAT|nr:unnamed protein product [Protopolystoma xenopodis]
MECRGREGSTYGSSDQEAVENDAKLVIHGDTNLEDIGAIKYTTRNTTATRKFDAVLYGADKSAGRLLNQLHLFFTLFSQRCYLDFGSLTYDSTQLELGWMKQKNSSTLMPYLDFSDYVRSNEWHTNGEEDMRHNIVDPKKKTQVPEHII